MDREPEIPMDREREGRPALTMSSALDAYLSEVLDETEHLTFGNPQDLEQTPLRLEDVWIPPSVSVVELGNALENASAKEHRLLTERTATQVDAALNMRPLRRVVVVGRPGFGKSTLCRRLTHLYAYDARSSQSGWIPVRVPLAQVNVTGVWQSLNDLLAQLPAVRAHPDATQALVLAGVQGHLWFFLDGLDEVSPDRARDLRTKLNSIILSSRNRVLITCRVADYFGDRPPRRIPNLPVLEMSGFTEDQLDTYLEQWHGSADERPGLARQRVRATRNVLDAHHELRELAQSPLLAAVLCVVDSQPLHGHHGRAALLRQAVDYLLVDPRWRREIHEDTMPRLDAEVLKALASHLAYDMLNGAPGLVSAGGGVRKQKLKAFVRRNLPVDPGGLDEEDLDRMVDAYTERLCGSSSAGLVQEREAGVLEFAHRSFQEFLAAGHLIKYVERTYLRDLALQQQWNEVFAYVASIGQATGEGVTDILMLTRTLLRRAAQAFAAQHNAGALAAAAVGACLAGDMLAELTTAAAIRYGFEPAVHNHGPVDPDDPAMGGLWTLAVSVLSAVAARTDLDRANRIRALCAVSRLRDPRFIDDDGRLRDDVNSFMVIPGGRGRVGTEEALPMREMKQVGSSPPLDVTVTPFEIGRFPVMNVQYREFIDAGGYDDPRYWVSEEARLWQAQEPQFMKRLMDLWDQQKELNFVKEFGEKEFSQYAASQSSRIVRRIMHRREPLYWQDSRFNLPTAPVVGVNLWEAQAYCHWLEGELKRRHVLGPDDVVTLPTEVEWEWAAGGSWTGRRRDYPWGDEFDPARCVTRDFSDPGDPKIVQFGAIPVGFFALVSAAVVPEDMAGNVWEWVSSMSLAWADTQDREKTGGLGKRIVRGGSWYSREESATHVCFRLDDPPCNAYWDLGFRVVVRRSQGAQH
jgi:formylglycine-generating enzyme required for sulfatase activity/energy-coupling factor transporter ATP-binding protein EcfA2